MIRNRAKKVTIPTCALLVIALTSLSPSPAQTAPATDSAAPAIEFDVVSIKLNKSGDAKMEHSFPANGDTMTFTNMPLFLIIMYLYNADRPGKLIGFPGWARAERYDITAKVTGASVAPFLSLDQAQRKVMLQKVLADRFKLQIHSEKMVSPVYELVAAKNGPRMRPAQDSEIPANGRTTLYNGFGQLTGQAATMEDLAYSLSDTPGMDRQVLDKTGLPGRYSFTLRFTLNQSAEVAAGSANTAADNPAPSIFAALQEQLGLKLEPANAPVERLVIDHIERPSEN